MIAGRTCGGQNQDAAKHSEYRRTAWGRQVSPMAERDIAVHARRAAPRRRSTAPRTSTSQ